MPRYEIHDFKRAKAGDEQAFERIFASHLGIVWSVFRRLNGCIATEQWQQECRIILMRCIDTLGEEQAQRLSGYFKKACLNYVANYFQRQLPRQSEYQQELNNDIGAVAEPIVNIYDRKSDKNLALQEILHELSNRERQIITLILAGYKQKEIARKLQVSKSLVGVEWRRLRQMLRK